MKKRIMQLEVKSYHIHKGGETIGASGSDRVAVLRISFDETWAGTTKTAYFLDALGAPAGAIVLGLDKLVEGTTEVYDVPVPAGAMAYPGAATLTVRGVAPAEETGTITTAAIFLKVPDSRIPEEAGELGIVEPTAAEQIQAEIDTLKAYFLEKAEAAREAKAAAQESQAAAKASETAAAASKEEAAESAVTALAARDIVEAGAGEELARQSAEQARAQAEEARGEAETARAQAENDRDRAEMARAQAERDRVDETTGVVASAREAAATAAESWARGGTGTREGEDTDNARYWSQEARKAAGGGVTSFKGRAGAVKPAEGDYTAEMVGAIPADKKGQANGVASLDGTGKVPGAQLPEMDYIPNSEKGEAGGVAALGEDGKVPSEQLPPMDYAPVAGLALSGGGGGGNLDDIDIQFGAFQNAGAGWQTFHFPRAFDGVPIVFVHPEDYSRWVLIRNVTRTGFEYEVTKPSVSGGTGGSVKTGSYYTASGTSSSQSHTANTLVNSVTMPSAPSYYNQTDSTAVRITWIALEANTDAE